MENDSPIPVDKIVQHWIKTSDDDAETMLILYNSGSYSWALFLGHISVEKLLKGIYVKKFEKHAPFTHNLYRLAELVEINVNEEQFGWLYEVTSFNLNARYDSYKQEFYERCTEDFTREWIDRITIIRLWLKKQF